MKPSVPSSGTTGTHGQDLLAALASFVLMEKDAQPRQMLQATPAQCIHNGLKHRVYSLHPTIASALLVAVWRAF